MGSSAGPAASAGMTVAQLFVDRMMGDGHIRIDVETGSGSTALGTFMYIDGYDDIYIRKMVDGVDVGQVVNNWSMLNAYPQEMIAQVEVIKGGSSSVWGSNMGGIINVVTKRPRGLTRPLFTLKSAYSHFGAMDFGGGNASASRATTSTIPRISSGT